MNEAKQESDITLTLTLAEVNQVLAALGQQPYANSYQIIHKIQNLAYQQVDSQNEMESEIANV